MFSIMIAQQANAAALCLKQSRPIFRIGLCIVTLGGILSFFEVLFELFTLTGNGLVRFELWRLLTHFTIETNVFVVILLIWNLHHLASLIEPNWGLFETIKYLSIVQIGSSLLIGIMALLTFVVTVNDSFFFRTHIFGLPSACSAVCVAVKQYLPDSVLFTTPIGRIKNTHLPFCILAGASFLVGSGFLRWVCLLQILLGIQISWMYLRFLQPHASEPRGDPSEHFAWATLFPSKLQPLARMLSSAVYTCLIRVNLCKPMIRHIDLMQLDSVNVVLPGLNTRDTERRRQKALRDLTERLNRMQQAEADLWPEMENVEEGITVQYTSSMQHQEKSGSQNMMSVNEDINAGKEKEKTQM